MATNISILKINASKEKVWHVLTDPAFVKLWQFGSVLTTDLKVGGSIRFTTEWEGNVFEQWGTIIEVKPPELLKYSLFAPRPDLEDKPENYFIMSYNLATENELTKLAIIQEDNRPGAKQEPPQGEENPVLLLLKQLAEGN